MKVLIVSRRLQKKTEWNSQTIINRSKNLIEFMEKHWDIRFNENCKEILINPTLALNSKEE